MLTNTSQNHSVVVFYIEKFWWDTDFIKEYNLSKIVNTGDLTKNRVIKKDSTPNPYVVLLNKVSPQE